jgi:hypothetical protein
MLTIAWFTYFLYDGTMFGSVHQSFHVYRLSNLVLIRRVKGNSTKSNQKADLLDMREYRLMIYAGLAVAEMCCTPNFGAVPVCYVRYSTYA